MVRGRRESGGDHRVQENLSGVPMAGLRSFLKDMSHVTRSACGFDPWDFTEQKEGKMKHVPCALTDFSICKGRWQQAMKGELTLLQGPRDLGLLLSGMMSSIDDFC